MKIYDCFIFNDEDLILDIRLNTLKEYVDYFVIIEFGETHQGNRKKRKLNLKKFSYLKNKIKYFYFDKFNRNLSSWEKENFQRNLISVGIKDAKSADIIMISDVDEIPNLKNYNFRNIKNNVIAFNHTHYMYNLNLVRSYNWIGTKACTKKILKSPQWLRSLKVHKKYGFFRLDKIISKTYYSKFKIIKNGGWHFGWIKKPTEIIRKINSYAHTEHNIPLFNDRLYIEKCIKKKISFLDNKEKLFIEKTKNLPSYIRQNLNIFKKWIIQK